MLCCEKDRALLPRTFRHVTLRPISWGKREIEQKQRKSAAEIMTLQHDFRIYLQDIAR